MVLYVCSWLTGVRYHKAKCAVCPSHGGQCTCVLYITPIERRALTGKSGKMQGTCIALKMLRKMMLYVCDSLTYNPSGILT